MYFVREKTIFSQIDELTKFIEKLPNGAILLDADGKILLANSHAIHLLQLIPDGLKEHDSLNSHLDWILPSGLPCPHEDQPISKAIQTGKSVINVLLGIQFKGVKESDTTQWLLVGAQPKLSLQGYVTYVVASFQDITTLYNQHLTLQTTQQRQQYHIQHAPLAIIEWDLSFKVIEWNETATRIFGYSRQEALGHHVTELIMSNMNVSAMNDVWKALMDTKQCSHNANENVTQSGKQILCEWYHTPLLNNESEVVGVASIAQDITEKQEIEQRLIYNAFHDGLTGLPNRSLFMRKLEATVKKYRIDQSPVHVYGVFFIDLDDFKFINDSLGHSVGDSLLIEVASRLGKCIHSTDIIARLGGDEFAILLAPMKTTKDIIRVAERMQKDLTQPFNLHGHEVFTGVSIGIAFMHPDISNGEVLLRNADTAMYRAKESGKSCYRVFTPDMYAQAVTRLEMESDMRRALERNEFELYYQPILSLRSRILFGFEALIRWHHPDKGLVAPSEFIPIAEETGFIKPLGHWVLEQACYQTQEWQTKFPTQFPLTVNVNLSAKQFSQPQLTQQIRTILQESHLPPHCLKLEITESVLMDHADFATKMIDETKQLGVQFAIDDFGTGYSSLGYLHRFSVDTLKIDRSFIRSLDTDVEKVELVRTILSLAWNLGMDVVAEGIETKRHLAQLRLLKCDYGQGYFFARPLPRHQITELLKTTWNDGRLQLLDVASTR